MLIGTAVAVVAIAVAIAFASTAGNGGGNPSGSPSPNANSGEPSSIPSVDSVAAASAVVKSVTLKPADWGSGYVAQDPYENSDLNEITVDQNCNWSTQPIAGAFTTLLRSSQTPDKAVLAYSGTTAYKAADSAQYGLTEKREALQRCPTQRSGKTQLEDVHEINIPELKGFDEVVAEEGHEVSDENGNKVDTYYTYLTGRKGNFVLTTEVDRSGTGSQEQNRNDASSALSLMLSRLEGGSSQ
ncbi:hypothetical protein [Streptomyces sp. NRRL S-337]|uniref:hypothetical protein n=1 Tax=Streptomyces sp. NRRL S-337 TaxID=1463900 RepID=UPI00131D6E78|nr:hypothetical protein [Streptomyces sp. NRRL S-337]